MNPQIRQYQVTLLCLVALLRELRDGSLEAQTIPQRLTTASTPLAVSPLVQPMAPKASLALQTPSLLQSNTLPLFSFVDHTCLHCRQCSANHLEHSPEWVDTILPLRATAPKACSRVLRREVGIWRRNVAQSLRLQTIGGELERRRLRTGTLPSLRLREVQEASARPRRRSHLVPRGLQRTSAVLLPLQTSERCGMLLLLRARYRPRIPKLPLLADGAR